MQVSRTAQRQYKRQLVINLNKWFIRGVFKVTAITIVTAILAYLMMIGIGYAVQQHDNKVTAIRQGVVFDD